jgi:hypothetical protein
MTINRDYRRLPTRRHITEIKYTGGNFSRKRINHEIERLRAKIPGKRYQVLLPYENYKPGNWFEDGDNISLFSLLDHYDESELPEGGGDPVTYNRFIVYMSDPIVLTGGCSPKRDNGLNDCLYQCLYFAYGTLSKLPQTIKNPDILKKALGLERCDPVPVNLIPKVEKLAETIAINITGDANILSKSKSHRRITLILTSGHYSLAKDSDRRETKAWTAKPKKPLIYQTDGVNLTVKTYDGENIRTKSIPDLIKLKAKCNSGQWCLIQVEKSRETGKIESLEDAYTRIHEERNMLLEESKKIGISIDLFRCHGNYKKVALWLFEILSRGISANKPLHPIEAKWISETMMGGIIWADNNWQGYGRQYDKTSLYPSIMQSALTFPIGKGKFQTLKDFVKKHEDGDYPIYGIYRAKVEYKEGMNALFRYNKLNKYTHIDLTRAKELGLKVELIQDSTPNSLVFEMGTRISGKVIFGEYVNFLFKLKNIGGTVGRVAKRVLNTLWGALCQRNRVYYDISDDMPELFDDPEGETLDTIIPIGDNRWSLQFSNPGNLFKGEYPRIAPFLMAQGRKLISMNIEAHKDKVRRVHTDGFILEEDPKKPPLIECSEDASKTLKELKFEKEGKCYVKNANQVTWNES